MDDFILGMEVYGKFVDNEPLEGKVVRINPFKKEVQVEFISGSHDGDFSWFPFKAFREGGLEKDFPPGGLETPQ